MEAYLFSFVVPYLVAAIAVVAMLRLAGMNVSKRPGKFIAAGIPLMLILLPFKQVPLARFVTGLNANFSITLTALLFALLLPAQDDYRMENKPKVTGAIRLKAMLRQDPNP